MNRFLANWKTTAGGALTVAAIVVAAFQQNSPNQKWMLIASSIIGGLTGVLAKDK